MKLQNLKVSACYESETNPRGKDFAGQSFNELVASVKEKGVLVPVLARPRPKNGKEYEIVAGNRRFRAAEEAGLAEIPAQVKEMTDVEAREAQIVENLQRADIHPLEEGEAYRKLIEQGKNYDLEAVAAKVGKSVTYIRNRLALTDLTESAAKAYRNDRITAGHAALIARLGKDDQAKVVKLVEHNEFDTADLRAWIQELTVRKLSAAPPWKEQEKVVAAMAPCEECNKKKGGDLFGAGAAEQCGDPTCFGRRLAAHIELTKRSFKEKKTPLTLVSSEYSNPPAGVLSSSQYKTLVGKDKCKSEHQALIVHGDDDIGRVIRICTDDDCPQHGKNRFNTPYKQTEKEKAARAREMTAQKAKREKFEKAMADALQKVKWPLSGKHLDALFELTMDRGTSFLMPLVKRRGLEAAKKKTSYGTSRDYVAPLRKFAEENGNDAKLRIIFEVFLPTYNPHWDGTRELKNKLKGL